MINQTYYTRNGRQYMQLAHKSRFTMTLYVVLFAAKLIRCLTRFRKRRQIIQQWINLQASNIASIAFITQKINSFQLPPQKIGTVLYGLSSIQTQSRKTTQQLKAVKNEKEMEFGSKIVDICISFEAYGQFLRKHVERQVIIKQIEDKEESRGKFDKTNLQQTAQKIVFRTYQLSLLIGKYIKCLHKGKDILFFRNAAVILANLNKKHDQLLKQEQKNKERERIQHIMGRKINSNFIYSQKCQWHLGPSTLYVFQTLVALQCAGTLDCIDLDKYCSVFSKQFDKLHMGCLVSKTHTLHIIFSYVRQLSKFLRVLDNLIHFEDITFLSSTQTMVTFAPFMVAQVVDYRPATDLRGNKRDQFTIIFSAIGEEDTIEADQMRNIMKQSGIGWTDVDFYSQPQQLNQTITLTTLNLEKVKELCEKQYENRHQLPKLMDYGGQVSKELITMLKWQTYLNLLLRSKTIINNPILLLKKLHVSDVFLESSLCRTALQSSSKQYHCKLCSCLDASLIQQFFRRKLRYLARKYGKGSYERKYCYYLLVKIRDQLSKVTVYELQNCMQLIAWHHLRNGRIDYSFRKKAIEQKKYFIEVSLLGVDQRSFEVQINEHSLVNDVIDQICLLANVPALFGFRLAIYFQDRELLLRPNQKILPLVDLYNIKCQKYYSPTLYSKFKQFGRLLQFSQNGLLLLKQVIFYPLTPEQTVLRQWLEQLDAYQFKCQKLIGLSRQCRLELIVLLGMRHLIKEKKQFPVNISHTIYQKFVPNSLEQEVQDCKNQIQKIYNSRKQCTLSQINILIQNKMCLSPFFRSYSWQMRICDMSQSLYSNYKKMKSVFLGISWSGISILTPNQKPIMRCSWQDSSFSLGTIGFKISNQTDSLTLKGLQLFQTYSLCKEYKALAKQAEAIKEN